VKGARDVSDRNPHRGRGPELKGTRITVYDVIPYRLAGRDAADIASILRHGYPAITTEHIEALFQYMDQHHDEVMAVHGKIEERNARGNPPEIEARLLKSREKLQAMRLQFARERAERESLAASDPVVYRRLCFMMIDRSIAASAPATSTASSPKADFSNAGSPSLA
jgi:uncharacterized protein (DUF433 family)